MRPAIRRARRAGATIDRHGPGAEPSDAHEPAHPNRVVTSKAHRVAIIGGGFGGLYAAKALKRAPVRVTLIDRRNFHLFQPLLYQVATAGLAPGDIASPLRNVLRRQQNAHVRLGEVVDIDPLARSVRLRAGEVEYDTLIVAAGSETAYFGHDDWEARAPGPEDDGGRARDAKPRAERV